MYCFYEDSARAPRSRAARKRHNLKKAGIFDDGPINHFWVQESGSSTLFKCLKYAGIAVGCATGLYLVYAGFKWYSGDQKWSFGDQHNGYKVPVDGRVMAYSGALGVMAAMGTYDVLDGSVELEDYDMDDSDHFMQMREKRVWFQHGFQAHYKARRDGREKDCTFGFKSMSGKGFWGGLAAGLDTHYNRTGEGMIGDLSCHSDFRGFDHRKYYAKNGRQEVCAVELNWSMFSSKDFDLTLHPRGRSRRKFSITSKFKFFGTRDYFIREEGSRRVLGILRKDADWSQTHYEVYLTDGFRRDLKRAGSVEDFSSLMALTCLAHRQEAHIQAERAAQRVLDEAARKRRNKST